MNHLNPHNGPLSPTGANVGYSKPIFLVGYMASGKTTFGEALAAFSGKVFIDLDEFIESRFEKSINEIFELKGEEGFREIERNALLECCRMPDAIVACGGGTPCFFNNMEEINKAGVSVFLDANEDVILSRLIRENSKRPLVKDKDLTELKDFVSNHLAQRRNFYIKAKIRFDSSHLENDQEIENSVKKFIADNPFVFSESFL